MKFTSNRQLVFAVKVNGQRRVVYFGERSDSGVSTFMTDDAALAEAIMQSQYARKGVIQMVGDELTPDAQEELYLGAAPQGTEQGTGNDGLMPDAQETMSPKTPSQGTETENAGLMPDAQEVMEFSSLTFAKNWLAKTFNEPKTAMKTPEAVLEIAKKHGVKITF